MRVFFGDAVGNRTMGPMKGGREDRVWFAFGGGRDMLDRNNNNKTTEGWREKKEKKKKSAQHVDP